MQLQRRLENYVQLGEGGRQETSGPKRDVPIYTFLLKPRDVIFQFLTGTYNVMKEWLRKVYGEWYVQMQRATESTNGKNIEICWAKRQKRLYYLFFQVRQTFQLW